MYKCHLLVLRQTKTQLPKKVWSCSLCCPIVTIFLVHICFKNVDESNTNVQAALFLALGRPLWLGMRWKGSYGLKRGLAKDSCGKKIGIASGLKISPRHYSKERQLLSTRWASCCTRACPSTDCASKETMEHQEAHFILKHESPP